MAIVKLKKVSLVCRQVDKEAVLRSLQSFGRLHLRQAESIEGKSGSSQTNEKQENSRSLLSDKLKKALRYLQDCPQKRKQILWTEDIDIENLIAKICENQDSKRAQTDTHEKLLERENSLKYWGNFDYSSLESIRGQRLWFYILPAKHLKALHELELPWQIVHQDSHNAWLVLISSEEPAHDLLPVDRFHTGSLPLSEVQAQRHQSELTLEDLEYERQSLTRYINVLKRLAARVADQSNLHSALDMSFETEPLCVLQAWLPAHDVPGLQALAKEQGFALQLAEVEDEDQAPTLLSNPQAIRGGEALVNFYQTPAYNTWDPSFMLFSSFSLFFAMIMSDAGYSAILFGLVLVGWRKLGKTEIGKNLRPLLASITVASLIWGILVGSYFGKEPAFSWLQAIHILNVNDFDSMMAISIGCGIVHLLLANLQQAILWWGHTKAVMHLGWMLVLVAGAAFGLKVSPNIAYAMGIAGLLLVFVGGGKRKIHGLKDFVIRFLEGLKAVSNVTNIFGDVLSYLRLFALGLASASLALTFNNLSDDAFASEGGLGILFGILILVVGHTLNLVLGIVSGVVHGLRLNFIEFNKWALDGEGKPFKAFKKQEYPQ